MNNKAESSGSSVTEKSHEAIASASEVEWETIRIISESHSLTLNHSNDESKLLENDETGYVIFIPPSSSQNNQENTANSPIAVPILVSRRRQRRRRCARLLNRLISLLQTYLFQSLHYTVSLFRYLVLPILLILPISAIVVGRKYFQDCPLNGNLPAMLISFGMLATTGIVLRILVLLLNKLYGTSEAHDDPCTLPKTMYYIVDFATTLFLCMEAFEVLRIYESSSLSPHSGSQNFCHPKLYNFAYWTSWTAIPVAISYFVTIGSESM